MGLFRLYRFDILILMKFLITILDYLYAIALKVTSYFSVISSTEFKPGNKTIIIIPGVYETPLYFKKLHQVIRKNHNVIFADSIYGNGAGIAENARALVKYMDAHDLHSVIVIGHSSGGLAAVVALSSTSRIDKAITIAAPFHGVMNGHFLRTDVVRELLPKSKIIRSFESLPNSTLQNVISMYPTFDNQVWSKKGSHLDGATNIRIKASGHHLILRSSELRDTIKRLI